MNRGLLLIIIATCTLIFASCRKDEEKIVLHADRISIEPYKGIKFDMVFVEGGTFYMGSQTENEKGKNYDAEALPDEAPVHKVTLNGYYIATTEVTQNLWWRVTGREEFYSEWGKDLPAYNISFSDAQTFIKHLNNVTGLRFRLPTEAEWEYAARGGKNSQGFKYSGSNNIDEVAWYYYNCDGYLHPVAQKKPNELGIYDMSGNVREWCSDWAEFYSSEEQVNPKGPESGMFRVFRGGSRFNSTRLCRVSYRLCRPSDNDDNLSGFRLVLDTSEVNQKILGR